MNKYALIGKSLKHSLSKLIHESFYKEFSIAASYDLVELEEDELEGFVKSLRLGKYQGINITIPYKKSLIKYLDYISPEARTIGSINTIKVENGKLYGFNTDYDGFIYMLDAYNIRPLGKNCYILGTGGASLAVATALNDLGAKSVSFVSRNPLNANAISYQALTNKDIQILVNATPVGMWPNNDNPLNDITLSKVSEVVDLIYNPQQTSLLKSLNSENNGLPMLIYQALRAEEIWQDKKYSCEEWLKKVGEELESNWK